MAQVHHLMQTYLTDFMHQISWHRLQTLQLEVSVGDTLTVNGTEVLVRVLTRSLRVKQTTRLKPGSLFNGGERGIRTLDKISPIRP